MLIVGVFFRGSEGREGGREELLQTHSWNSKANWSFVTPFFSMPVCLTFLTTVQVAVLVFATGKMAF